MPSIVKGPSGVRVRITSLSPMPLARPFPTRCCQQDRIPEHKGSADESPPALRPTNSRHQISPALRPAKPERARPAGLATSKSNTPERGPNVQSTSATKASRIGVPNGRHFSAMRREFQPRACIAARSFLLEGRSAFLAFVVNGTTSTRCRNTRRQYCSWQLVRALAGCIGGIPNGASFGSTGVFLSLSRVSTRFPFISKGEFVFLSVAKRIIKQPGSDHAVVDASPPHTWWAARLPPVGTRTGRRTGRVSARSRFCPGRSRATSFRIGADTPRSCSRREGRVETIVPVVLGLRCHPFGQPSQPREAGRRGRRVPVPVDSRQAL